MRCNIVCTVISATLSVILVLVASQHSLNTVNNLGNQLSVYGGTNTQRLHWSLARFRINVDQPLSALRMQYITIRLGSCLLLRLLPLQIIPAPDPSFSKSGKSSIVITRTVNNKNCTSSHTDKRYNYVCKLIKL